MQLIGFSAVFVILSYLTPLFSLFFSIGLVGDKILSNSKSHQFYIGVFSFLLLLFIVRVVTLVDFFEILIVAVVNYIYFTSLLKGLSYTQTIVKSLFYAAILFTAQFIFFRGFYTSTIQGALTSVDQFLSQMGLSADAKQSVEIVKAVFLNSFIAIYTLIVGFALYLGTLFLSHKKVMKKWEHALFELPDYFTYILIFGLAVFIIPAALPRRIGINLLLILALPYFIQGVSVILFLFKKYFKKTNLYIVFFIVLLIMNNLFMILLSLLGVFDRWFDFRRLHKS